MGIKVTIKQPPKVSVRLGATVVRSSDNQMIAPNFSEATVYHVGDYVVYRSGLYKAIEDGIIGQWNPAQWIQTDVAESKQDVIEDLDDIRHGAELGETALQEVPDDYRTGTEQDIIDATKYSPTNPPPYPVTSVNGKTGAPVLNAEDVGALPASTTIPTQLSQLSGDSTHRTVTDTEKSTWNNKYAKPAAGIPATDLAESVQGSLALADSAIQTESDPTVPTWAKQPNKPSYTASEISDNGTTVAAEISAINGKISSQASASNKLVSESEMGDAIAAVEAKQLYANNSQGQFATKAALTGATTFYNADGTVATPTKNDVAYVLADESHDGKSAKYVVVSVSGSTVVWGFVITFSSSTFSQAQMDAINSGITQTKREGYDSHVVDTVKHVTAAEKAGWDGKQDTRVFVITEDMFDLTTDDTKGVAPYSTSYGYTNIDIHADAGVSWIVGAIYVFILDTKVATSANRNVRLRIGGTGDYIPMMDTGSTIASGSTVFVKAITDIFICKDTYPDTYKTDIALHAFNDTNTTYTLNYLTTAGIYKSGVGAYAISRYALCMQKPDGTWEKIVDPTKTYSTDTTKTVNTRGFRLNRIRYYSTTTNVANGAFTATNKMYEQSASVDMRYSTNCGTPASWTAGDYIYLVGTIGSDGLFYLDTTRWWTNELPDTADGKLYIQIGIVLTTGSYTIAFHLDRPILYYDATYEEMREYREKGEKGEAGADGHTPVKGTDYWTAADKAEIVQDVLDALPDADETRY